MANISDRIDREHGNGTRSFRFYSPCWNKRSSQILYLYDLKKSTDLEGWTEIITPKVSLLNIRLDEIWRYRDLLWLLVRRDFISQYKQTILGPIWHLIQPIFTTIIFLFIFSRVANIPTDGIQPALFYMSGISIWNYFSSCLINTSNTFISNAGIFGKVYFPRLIMPMSIILSNLYRFGIQFGLLIILNNLVLFSWKSDLFFI